jgi:hypothetical protein
MSFSFSPSDILAVVNLASKAYNAWKSACGEYADITGLLDTLHILLGRVEREARMPGSVLVRREQDRKELRDVLANCSGTVRELSRIVERYKSLGLSKSRERNWDRLRFGIKNLEGLRGKLTAHIAAISGYIDAVGLGSLTRIERELGDLPDRIQSTIDALAAEIRAGRREGSIMTTYEDDEKDVWRQFPRELIGEGLRSSLIHRYKPKIRDYLRSLAESGLLEEGSESGVAASDEAQTQQTESSSGDESAETQAQVRDVEAPAGIGTFKAPIAVNRDERPPMSAIDQTPSAPVQAGPSAARKIVPLAGDNVRRGMGATTYNIKSGSDRIELYLASSPRRSPTSTTSIPREASYTDRIEVDPAMSRSRRARGHPRESASEHGDRFERDSSDSFVEVAGTYDDDEEEEEEEEEEGWSRSNSKSSTHEDNAVHYHDAGRSSLKHKTNNSTSNTPLEAAIGEQEHDLRPADEPVTSLVRINQPQVDHPDFTNDDRRPDPETWTTVHGWPLFRAYPCRFIGPQSHYYVVDPKTSRCLLKHPEAWQTHWPGKIVCFPPSVWAYLEVSGLWMKEPHLLPGVEEGYIQLYVQRGSGHPWTDSALAMMNGNPRAGSGLNRAEYSSGDDDHGYTERQSASDGDSGDPEVSDMNPSSESESPAPIPKESTPWSGSHLLTEENLKASNAPYVFRHRHGWRPE